MQSVTFADGPSILEEESDVDESEEEDITWMAKKDGAPDIYMALELTDPLLLFGPDLPGEGHRMYPRMAARIILREWRSQKTRKSLERLKKAGWISAYAVFTVKIPEKMVRFTANPKILPAACEDDSCIWHDARETAAVEDYATPPAPVVVDGWPGWPDTDDGF